MFTHSSWNRAKYQEFIEYLLKTDDPAYRKMNTTIVVSSKYVIGVRVPNLRLLAKEISKGNWKSFLDYTTDHYFEESMLEGMVIASQKYSTFQELKYYFYYHIDKIESWATCDNFCAEFKVIKKYRTQFLVEIEELFKSNNPWRVRVATIMLLTYYIDEEHLDYIFKASAKYDAKEYYVSMGIAWLISVVFVKHQKRCMEFLLTKQLTEQTLKRAIRKIKDSFRVDNSIKESISILL